MSILIKIIGRNNEMKTNIKFSQCLGFLLTTLDISINRLAKAINVDSSLVNRWVNGKRMPSYKTTYIYNIAEYLSKNIQNSFQMQHISDFYYNICGDSVTEVTIEEKIKKILSESQGYSIECRKMDVIKNKTHIIGKEQIPNYNYTPSINLSNKDKLIIGNKSVLSKAISLLEAAANEKCKDNSTIFISFINDICFTRHNHNALIYCRNIILKAINNGWNILFLLRLDNNYETTIKFINFSKPLIKTGKLNLYYITKYETLNTGKDIIVVPEIGALLTMSTTEYLESDRAFYFKNNAAIDTCMEYFNTLLRNFAKPIVKYYSIDNSLQHYEFLAHIENNIGNQFLYEHGFSIITLPEKLYKKLLNKKKLTHSRLLMELDFYRRRLNAFLSNISKYEYWDIYSMDSIENLIKHGEFYFYSYEGIEIMHMETEDIIEYLQNIINLLEAYENYNIGVLPHNPDNDLSCTDFCCIVKERQAAIIEVYGCSKLVPEIRFSIEEPMLVKALDEHFKDIWAHISPVNKSKNEIITWIHYHINLLKNNYKLS